MADLLGLTAIALISVLTFFLASYQPKIAKILFVALAVRIIVLLFGHYIVDLPDSGKDDLTFENKAWEWAQFGFLNTINQYPGPDSSFVSWIIALIYSVTGRSLLLAKSISLLFGMGSVFLGWLLTLRIWDERSASKAGWFFALYPTLILYSCLTLREAYISFFLLVAMFGIVNWAKEQSFKSTILSIFGFTAATFFHGGMIIGGVTFLIIIFFRNIYISLISLKRLVINLKIILIIFLISLIIGIYISQDIYIPKIATFEVLTNLDIFIENINQRTVGDASYPEWLSINSANEIIYKGPFRIFYFMFSPLLIDVEKISHLFGFFDGIIYALLVFFTLRNKKVIWKNIALRTILIVLASYFVAFGLVIGNFGTAIRHRAKFIITFILLIAPLLPKFIVSKKIKK